MSFSLMNESDWAAAAAKVATGLHAAAGSSRGLYLQQVSFNRVDSDMAGLLLRQLPASHLTSLALDILDSRADDTLQDATGRPADLSSRSLATALAGLSKLRDLNINCVCKIRSSRAVSLEESLPLDPHIMAALPALTALTSLTLPMCTKAQLSCLQQLHQLELLNLPSILHCSGFPLQLWQLTAVTQLFCGYCPLPSPGMTQLVLEAGDLLPPNLQHLALSDCSSTQPLRALTSLTYLALSAVMYTSTLPGVLQQLSSLETLMISYAAAARNDAIAVPAAQLAAEVGVAAARLRYLDISNLPSSAAVVAAAHVVRHLTGLERLAVHRRAHVSDEDEDEDEDEDDEDEDENDEDYEEGEAGVGGGRMPVKQAAVLQLVAAVAGLPRLQSLSLSDFVVDLAAAKVLAASISTHLTSLTLYGAKMTDLNLGIVCCGVTQLIELDVQYNRELVLRDLLPFVVKFMPSLIRLRCDMTLQHALPAPARELLALINGRARSL
eukprot:gene5387-5623_t